VHVVWDAHYDVVCVGSGAGGLAAAVVAADRGARVLVVEKDDKLGGVTALTGGQIWIAPNPYQTGIGVEDQPDDALAYMDFLSAGMGDRANRKAFVARGGEALSHLRDLGLGLCPIPAFPDYYYPDAPGSRATGRYLEPLPFSASGLGSWADRIVVGQGAMTTQHGGSALTNADLADAATDPARLGAIKAARLAQNERCMGSGLVANLVSMALEAGVTMWTASPALRLIGEACVEGIEVGGDDRKRRIEARSVVLATGAYDWSPELVETHEFVKDMYSLTPPTVTGDHFKLAAQFRAATATTLPQGCSRHVGIHIPGESWGGRPFYRMMIMGLPHCIMVNGQGRRFGDESFFHTYSSTIYAFDGHRQSFPNWPAWFVFDQTYRDKYPIGPITPREALPQGMAVTAETITALATAAGINPSGLEETVERFNEHAERGVDPDFERGSKLWSHSWGDSRQANPNLGPVLKPPFYAISLARVGTGLASAGLKTDAAAHVIGIDGIPIEGLYAIGNAAARIEMGCGYNSGMAIGRSLVFAYLAACDAVPGR
jgi:3-oxosteroid 1-dehydrogenase